jgi:hypothetical protein
MSLSFKEYIKIDHEQVDENNISSYFVNQGFGKIDAIKKARSYVKTIINISNNALSDAKVKDRYRVYESVDDVCFGQFIAIETTISYVREQWTAVAAIVSEFLRPKGENVYSNDDKDLQKAHIEAIMDEAAEDVFYYYQNIIKEREHFHFVKYKDVYFSKDEDDDTELVVDKSKVESDPEKNFFRNWYWYDWVRQLAKEDLLKYESVMLQPMSVIAPECSYIQGYRKIERQRAAEEEVMMKIRSS